MNDIMAVLKIIVVSLTKCEASALGDLFKTALIQELTILEREVGFRSDSLALLS